MFSIRTPAPILPTLLLTLTLSLLPTLAAAQQAPPAAKTQTTPARPLIRPPRTVFAADRWYLSTGLSTGAVVRSGGAGYLLGGELSLSYFAGTERPPRWGGLMADVLWDAGRGQLHADIGPQIGVQWLGLDGGYALEAFGPRGLRHGVQARLVATAALVGLYARTGAWFDREREVYGHFGVLIKIPVPLGSR